MSYGRFLRSGRLFADRLAKKGGVKVCYCSTVGVTDEMAMCYGRIVLELRTFLVVDREMIACGCRFRFCP